MMGDGWFWGHMGFGWLFWIVIIVLFVWLLTQAVGRNRDSESRSREETPLEILKKRYARGEISHEEYERMKKDLME